MWLDDAHRREQAHSHAHVQIHAHAYAGRSLAQSLTHNMLNLTAMTNVSSLSLSANTSPRFFSRASSEVDEVCVHLQISASLRPLPLSLPPSLPPPLSPCRFSTHTHTQVEGALLRNVHHRVTSPRSRNNVTSPQRKATSLAAHSLDGRSPSKSKTHADKTGGGGEGGGGWEGRDTSILSAASPFAAVMPLSFINQVSKLFQQHQQPPSHQVRAAVSSGRASHVSHELDVQRASASAKCNASSSSSSSSSATVATASSQAPVDAVAWDEYEKLKSVRLLRATRKVFVFFPFWVRFVGCGMRGDRGEVLFLLRTLSYTNTHELSACTRVLPLMIPV